MGELFIVALIEVLLTKGRHVNAIVKNITVVMLLVLGAAPSFADGFRATIFFADGRSVPVEYFGETDHVDDPVISGRFGEQKVSYHMSELGAVIFTDYQTRSYRGKTGSLIVVSKSGKRFTLTGASISEHLQYFYLDPVTEARRHAMSGIENTITHIEINEHSGELKKSPETGEFFPAQYSFDPFNGKKLIWANRVE